MRLLFLLSLILATACHTPEPTVSAPKPKKNAPVPDRDYRAAYTRTFDILHTSLDVRPDWQTQTMEGKATLTMKPYFYATDSLALNARNMILYRVALLQGNDTLPLTYTYDSSFIRIKLDTVYTRERTFRIFISYKSQPETLKPGGSAAIYEDKGLYFINPDGSDPTKPRQIWTQGETESNSAWFPTIEDPQLRMTQDICITVDTGFVTLSNGIRTGSHKNADGSRTDCWRQSLPAAPYLTMIAVGDFAIVRDHWRNLDVEYYVEHPYEQYARMTFGHTPEMMDFFSQKLGVDYPWEKYSQIVVREYVSGAMENTTAVVHREALQQTSREYLDEDFEDYIAHELAHHWFGNLVTLESWSNVVLNEGFANYAQYLWREYKFGRDNADHHRQTEEYIYLYLAPRSDEDVVRYHYGNREDMYDVISYNKGGLILHMLRKVVGDDAFFAALKEYLVTNKYQPVEIHNLRLAFEKVTGKDMNWFFKQWYLDKGYPELDIKQQYDDSSHQQTVTIRQTQDFSKSPLYRLPMAVDIYVDGKAERHQIILDDASERFDFTVNSRPDLVIVDAERAIIGNRKEEKPRSQWIYQYEHAPLYIDRYEAVSRIGDDLKGKEEEDMMVKALDDPYWNIRALALKRIGPVAKTNRPGLRTKIELMATSDPKSLVREAAIKVLAKQYDDTVTQALMAGAINDSSYTVVTTAFDLLSDRSKERAARVAPSLENESNDNVMDVLAAFYVSECNPGYNNFFRHVVLQKKPGEQQAILDHYGNYLALQETPIRRDGMEFLDSLARKAQPWPVRLASYGALGSLRQELVKTLENPKGSSKILNETDLEAMQADVKLIEEKRKSIKAAETNPKLLRYYNR